MRFHCNSQVLIHKKYELLITETRIGYSVYEKCNLEQETRDIATGVARYLGPWYVLWR